MALGDIAVGDVYRARLFCYDGSQLAVNDLLYVCDAVGGTSATDQAFANRLGTLFGTIMRALMGSAEQYYGSSVSRLFPLAPFPTTKYSATGRGAGTTGTVCLPKQTCGLVRKESLVRGRRNRGRIYLPFPSVNYNELDGVPTAAYLTAAGTVAAQVANGIVVGTVDTADMLPIVSYAVVGGVAQVVSMSGAAVSTRWATQRRRGDFGRVNPLPF